MNRLIAALGLTLTLPLVAFGGMLAMNQGSSAGQPFTLDCELDGSTITCSGSLATSTSTPTALPASSTSVPTHTATRTAVSTPTASASAAATSSYTATRTPTRTPAPAPTATPAVTVTQPATPPIGAGCLTNCGTPRFFCDVAPASGSWAFCDDHRDLYCPSLNFLNDCKFPNAGTSTRVERRFGPFGVSATVLDVTDPIYSPNVSGQLTPAGWWFNQQEHMHSQVEDGNFGLAILRYHQPVDLSAERHIHFEVDLDTSARRYVRILLAPELTKVLVDDRDPANEIRPNVGLDFWILNGTYVLSSYPNYPDGGVFYTSTGRYYGVNNVRDDVDMYVSRTRFRMLINGVEKVNVAVPQLTFDKAYLYFVQASYNPCKDQQCAEAQQIKHWDNTAFDGPVLAPNSLTPAGYRDILWNAYGQASCGIGTYLAVPMGPPQGYSWHTFVARVPDDGTTYTAANVTCTNGSGGNLWPNRLPRDFEIVDQTP